MDNLELAREMLTGGGYGKVRVLTPEGDELEVTLVEREQVSQDGTTIVWLRTELA